VAQGASLEASIREAGQLDLAPFLQWRRTYPGSFRFFIWTVFITRVRGNYQSGSPRKWLCLVASDHVPMVAEVHIWTQGKSQQFSPGLNFQISREIPMRRQGGDLRSQLSDEELFRATGASLIHGNHLRILWDAQGNYPAWERRFKGPERRFTWRCTLSITIRPDAISGSPGGQSRQGVKVRVIYDWFGSLSLLGGWMWKPLREAGGGFGLPSAGNEQLFWVVQS